MRSARRYSDACAVVAALVVLLAALAATADMAAAAGPTKSRPWTLVFGPEGATRLGPLSLSTASAPTVTARLGKPSALRRTTTGCTASWRSIGLTLSFITPVVERDACGADGRIERASARGRFARMRYRTSRGLLLGAASRRITELHRAAASQGGGVWWLGQAYSPVMGRAFGIVEVRVARSRVDGFVALTGATPSVVARSEGGVWNGPVRGDTSDYTLTMALRAGAARAGERVGVVDYPALECGAVLTFLDRTLTRVRVAERIVYGAPRCVDTGVITLRATASAGAWSYVGTSSDAPNRRPTALLQHADILADVSDRVDAAEAGQWRGKVTGDSSNYYVELSLNAGALMPGALAGVVQYPELGCGGNLVFVARTYTTVVMREQITFGTSRCVIEGEETLALSPAGAQWAYDGERRLHAALARP